MTGIVKRGENTYRFTVSVGFDGNGNHIRKTTTYKIPSGVKLSQLDKRLTEAYIDFSNRCKGMKNLNENIRFKELVEIYFRDFAPNELKPATIYNYEKDLHRHMLPVFGNKKIKDIAVSDLSTFFTSLDLSPASTRKMKTIMSSVFHFGVQQGYVKENPCIGALHKKNTHSNKKVNFYTKEQSKQLMELTSQYSKFNTIIQFLMFTGLRCGECLSLNWSDIDLENNIIRIDKTLTYADKKWFTTAPKTENSYRTIKLSNYAKSLLLRHKEKQDEGKAIVGTEWVEPDLVFTSWKGNFYDRSLLNTQLRRFLEKNDMSKITIHGLRHTNASLMINNGIDIKAVSAHLGHCNISITGDIYGHIFDEYEVRIAEVVEGELV